jgi:hypothetical protein
MFSEHKILFFLSFFVKDRLQFVFIIRFEFLVSDLIFRVGRGGFHLISVHNDQNVEFALGGLFGGLFDCRDEDKAKTGSTYWRLLCCIHMRKQISYNFSFKINQFLLVFVCFGRTREK